MHRFIPVSDENGITLVGTYNPASAANPPVPYKWRIFYAIPGERALIREAAHLTEPQLGDRLQDQALHYIGDHPLVAARGRLPQHPPAARARGHVRLAGLGRRDRPADRPRPGSA